MTSSNPKRFGAHLQEPHYSTIGDFQMSKDRQSQNLRRAEIRIGRSIRALLQKGMTADEVAELLELDKRDFQLWVQMADEKLN